MDLDLEALETSFDLVAPRGDELMDVFYRRLFEAAPAVRPLFAATDLQGQKTMLLGSLVLLRKSLPTSTRSSRGFASSGRAMLPTAPGASTMRSSARSLIAAMAELAGEAWRNEYAAAWGQAFSLVAGAMLEGAAAEELATAA